jgi:DNA-binding MarR family transcriptional regulator
MCNHSHVTQERLDAEELAAWRGFLRVHSDLTQRLDAELREAHDLPLTSYEVLLFLNDSAEGALRMSQLADSVLLSRSGLTRLVDRLQKRGLVARADSPDDGRGCLALITDGGRELFAAARRTHLAGVRRMFLEPLSAARRRELAGAWDELLP